MRFWMIIIFCARSFIAPAQTGGTRVTALGYSAVALKDPWNINLNPSGITNGSGALVTTDFTIHNLLPELTTKSLALILPFRNNTLGFSLQQHGLTEFNWLNFGMAYAKTFGKMALGISGSTNRVKAEGYPAATQLSGSIGLQYNLNEQLLLGTYLHAVLAKDIERSIKIASGLSYLPNPKVIVAVAVQYAPSEGNYAAVGVDYQPVPNCFFRAGVSLPFAQYAGIGFKRKRLSFDFAIKVTELGYSPQIGLAYAL